jgi:hypothetical protein
MFSTCWGMELQISERARTSPSTPGSQLRTIPDCAHLAQEDATEEVLGHLIEFFSHS